MRRPILLAALFAVSAASLAPLAAQRSSRDRGIVELAPEPTRGGFYATLGLGAGREQYKYSDDLEFSEALTKPTVTIRLGGTPNANMRIGAELFAWGSDEAEGYESFSTAMVAFQYFPIRDQGLYLKAAGGVARSAFEADNPTELSPVETGFGWSVGAGLDIQVSRRVGIGPMIDLYTGTFTRRNEPTLTERVLNIGVQVTYQSGSRGR